MVRDGPWRADASACGRGSAARAGRRGRCLDRRRACDAHERPTGDRAGRRKHGFSNTGTTVLHIQSTLAAPVFEAPTTTSARRRAAGCRISASLRLRRASRLRDRPGLRQSCAASTAENAPMASPDARIRSALRDPHRSRTIPSPASCSATSPRCWATRARSAARSTSWCSPGPASRSTRSPASRRAASSSAARWRIRSRPASCRSARRASCRTRPCRIAYSLEYGLDEMEMHEDAVAQGRPRRSWSTT